MVQGAVNPYKVIPTIDGETAIIRVESTVIGAVVPVELMPGRRRGG